MTENKDERAQLSRRELLKKAGAGAAAIGVAGAARAVLVRRPDEVQGALALREPDRAHRGCTSSPPTTSGSTRGRRRGARRTTSR